MSEVQALVECPVIVGTAGHVDHGKSALIEALTGKNPDRLEVERRRGMTVELGFGELALPSGKIVGLVDVPGHAHYLRAMVQGATGIDVAVLVVSAVEGVMPQTREHVHVLELGAGTVVTGTLHDAPVAVGDELMALPSRTVCRVRGIQVHDDTPRALPGQRVALNLVGDAVAALDRGEMLGVQGRFGQTMRFMMVFTYLGREGAKPRVLESGARVHVMAGTAEVVGRIMFMEGEAPMAVGETRIVQVRLENSLPLRAGDHAVVLSYSPVMLIGGGRSSPAISRAVWALGWRCRRCRLRRLMLPRRWILASARSMPYCAGWWRRAPFANLPRVIRTSWRTPWCSTPRWMHWRRPCQPCTRRLPRRQALRPAPLPMLRGLPLMKALPRP